MLLHRGWVSQCTEEKQTKQIFTTQRNNIGIIVIDVGDKNQFQKEHDK